MNALALTFAFAATQAFLKQHSISEEDIATIVGIIGSIGFKEELAAAGGPPGRPALTTEAAVVQDADR